ncbi:PaaI family thioesterase [Bosea caraganae]|uniref:PaaI family thioesterase n=1 Tax=Bosea caraganae TaxID=2763117 RepID=A0A370L060_9HYPH|nr:PaaI family thioesterase [Bosea caraganae]RDJ20496.1 PaaI family thioesterase [Bosea caraganae]RDJ30011.1 PaaI family thioesterase [Bosea caraganae]
MPRTIGVVSRDVLLAEDGLSFLRGIIEGRHPGPPFADAMDFDIAEAEAGRVVFVGKPSARFFNPLGTIHGGWTATILDSAMACAAHSTLKAGEGYTTLEMKLNYVRPVMPESEIVRCEGRLIHRGGSIITSEGKLVDARGKLLAHGTETCLVLRA